MVVKTPINQVEPAIVFVEAAIVLAETNLDLSEARDGKILKIKDGIKQFSGRRFSMHVGNMTYECCRNVSLGIPGVTSAKEA